MLKRVRYLRILLALFLIIPSAIFASAKGSWPTQLGGYKAVRVHYGPLNKMIMPVNINGQPANLLVDTGASHVMLDADTAASFGIKPSNAVCVISDLTKSMVRNSPWVSRRISQLAA